MDADTLLTVAKAGVSKTRVRRGILEAKRRLHADLMSSVNLKDAEVNGEPRRLVITHSGKEHKCEALSMPDELLFYGDLVHFDGSDWLVMETSGDVVFQQRAALLKCNHRLRFQLFDSAVHERICVFDSGNYSTTLQGNADMQLLNRQFKLYMHTDGVAERIPINKRLAFGMITTVFGEQILNVMRVDGRDIFGGSKDGRGGLLTLMLGSDAYAASLDSLEQGLCDYRELPSAPSVISGPSKIRAGSSMRYAVLGSTEGVQWSATVGDIDAQGLLTIPDRESLCGALGTVCVALDGKIFEKQIEVI